MRLAGYSCCQIKRRADSAEGLPNRHSAEFPVDGGILNVVEDGGRTEIWSCYLDPDVLQRETTDIARVEAVGGHGAECEVFAGDLGKIASRIVRGEAAAAEREADIVERDIFHGCIADAIERDAGVALAWVGSAGDLGPGELRGIRGHCSVNVAEGYVAEDRGRYQSTGRIIEMMTTYSQYKFVA